MTAYLNSLERTYEDRGKSNCCYDDHHLTKSTDRDATKRTQTVDFE